MVTVITRRIAVLMVLAACARAPRFLVYNGPAITEIRLYKAERRLELWHEDQMLHQYVVGLGQNPIGHKEFEGDSRTPEGAYIIDRRNPQSTYHLSLGISYPNAEDIAHAEAAGLSPGGDIFIHGQGPGNRRRRGDWSVGCITVTDREIEDIYSMVQDGTPIMIYP